MEDVNARDGTSLGEPNQFGMKDPKKPSSEPINEVLTAGEVASYLRVSLSTIYRLLKSGDLPAFKIGSDWRFNRTHIEEWLKSRAQTVESGSSSDGASPPVDPNTDHSGRKLN